MSRFRREDWLELALNQLGRVGPEGLTVQALCARAERTRGSLYHHFRDVDTLLDALIAYWAARDTQALIAAVGPDGDPQHLNDLAMALDLDVEVGMRRLVAQHARLRPALATVDQARIEFLTTLHTPRHGPDADVMAKVEYAAFLGFTQLEPRPRPDEMRQLYARFEQRLARGPRS